MTILPTPHVLLELQTVPPVDASDDVFEAVVGSSADQTIKFETRLRALLAVPHDSTGGISLLVRILDVGEISIEASHGEPKYRAMSLTDSMSNDVCTLRLIGDQVHSPLS